MAKKLSSNPNIFLPETVDELLDICASILRTTGGKLDGPTVAHIFPIAGLRDNFEDLIVFNNGRDMPLCVWGISDGVNPAVMLEKVNLGACLFAYRIDGNNSILQFPVRNLKLGWTQWVTVREPEKYVGNAWVDDTQFVGAYL